jgi:hypothetical protein
MLQEALEDLEARARIQPYVQFVVPSKLANIEVSGDVQKELVTISHNPINTPNYIDPSTGRAWNPYRHQSARDIKLHKLRMLRAVLP